MNKEFILKVADHIEQQPHTNRYAADGFTMSCYIHDCGTPACIAGHTIALHAPGHLETFREIAKNDSDWNAYILEGARLLDINYTQAQKLFVGTLHATPLEAATCLRLLEATDSVDWDLAMSRAWKIERDAAKENQHETNR